MNPTPRSGGSVRPAISARQAQIAALVACGWSTGEVARALWLSPRTVDAHLAALFNKLNISSRTELTATLFLTDNGTPGVPELATVARISAFREASIGRSRLSTRHAQIAAQIALGKSNREIAVALRLSPRTVDAHLRTLFDKLDLRSRGELIAALYLESVRPRQTSEGGGLT